MALVKTPVNINFMKGIDTKSDPYQLGIDSFLLMQNSVFTTTGRITKRNGYPITSTLPNTLQTTLTTLNDNLIATGSNLYALSQDTNTWLNQGTVQPIQLNTLPLIRVSTSQTGADTAVATNGLLCLAYMDNGQSYYQVSDSVTGQQIVSRKLIPGTAADPRTFLLGQYFVVTFTATVGGTPHLQYIAIPVSNPNSPTAATDISTVIAAVGTGYDAYVANNTLFIAWSASDAGGAVRLTAMSSTLVVRSSVIVDTDAADLVSVNVDPTLGTLWVSYWNGNNLALKTAAYNLSLIVKRANSTIQSNVHLKTLTSTARTNLPDPFSTNYIFYEINNTYASPYPVSGINTNYVATIGIPEVGSAPTNASILLRSVGLASKSFLAPSQTVYVMVTYGESNHDLASSGPDQNTYFLMDQNGNVFMRLAYSNGGGYESSQVLPTVTSLNGSYYVPYLVNDFLSTVNKTTNSAIPINAIYTQTGVNLAKFSINMTGQYSSEIAGALFLTGGQLWEYDGVTPVEYGFQVWPDNVQVTTATGSGSIAAGTYFYQFCYEWTDNQGNLIRSAPSVPVSIVTTTASSTNTIYVPTLRITYKDPQPGGNTQPGSNPPRIVGYRWSVAQQVYYQFTSITSPTINDPTIDFVTITDAHSDAQIIGNNIIYTTGGVLENIAPPASIHSTLFNNRLWLIDAEDPNLLWYSKQVIVATPVEMSDLLTIYVAPTTGSQGSTGPMTALAPMDDKLIIFKNNAMYYINGIGPDNTGANSTYSDPVFITGAVGCINPRSIVLIPNGLMFQSDKGIWLLGRDLNTSYIGAPVEGFNSDIIRSAQAIPGTNQARFILDNNITLMYDYFFNQWGTFTNIRAISATLWQDKHTYLNSFGQIFQETPNTYLDGSTPVLLALTSAWINIAGLQGFERFYSMHVLGTYYTPYKLSISMAYNYNSSPRQATIVSPDNFAGQWGSQTVWGSGPQWGGSEGNVFTARIFPEIQKCQSFQVSIQEVYDATLGVVAGQGLTLSGIQLLVGVKRGTRTQSAAKSFG